MGYWLADVHLAVPIAIGMQTAQALVVKWHFKK